MDKTIKKHQKPYKIFFSILIMPAQDTSKIKNKMLFFLSQRGPSLPVHLATEIGLSILFTSAFLSELLSEKRIKISNMRVGNSPVYFLQGQEISLEKFSQYLKSKEKDAFLLLKEKKFLKDIEQEPAIRVALRAIKDFAIPFQKNEEIFWRYFTASETELNIKQSPEQKLVQEPIIQKIPIEKKSQNINLFEKDQNKKIVKNKSKKEKSVFAYNVLDFLNENNLHLQEEIDFKKREYNAKIQVDSDLGKIDFLLQAKDKKKISTDDLMDLIKKAKSRNLPALFLYTGELNKKAKEYALEYSQILKLKQLKN